jgi:hypothetical protein
MKLNLKAKAKFGLLDDGPQRHMAQEQHGPTCHGNSGFGNNNDYLIYSIDSI